MILRKKKLCKTCEELKYLFSNGNCQYCDQLLKLTDKPFKPLTQSTDGKSGKPFKVYSTKDIKKVTTRQQKLNAAYLAQRKVYLRKHPICEASLSNCSFVATQVHHRRGRGEYLLDECTWLPVCFQCHEYIEQHPAEAKARGFSLDRLSK